jgi:hypothetical protein
MRCDVCGTAVAWFPRTAIRWSLMVGDSSLACALHEPWDDLATRAHAHCIMSWCPPAWLRDSDRGGARDAWRAQDLVQKTFSQARSQLHHCARVVAIWSAYIRRFSNDAADVCTAGFFYPECDQCAASLPPILVRMTAAGSDRAVCWLSFSGPAERPSITSDPWSLPRVPAAQHDAEEWSDMQPQALYVVSDQGRERFIWAASAKEAKALVADAQTAAQEQSLYDQTKMLRASPSWPPSGGSGMKRWQIDKSQV